MILRMFELSDLFKKEEIGELIRMSEKYLKCNGYKYLNNGIFIFTQIIIIYLFSNRKIVMQNEN